MTYTMIPVTWMVQGNGQLCHLKANSLFVAVPEIFKTCTTTLFPSQGKLLVDTGHHESTIIIRAFYSDNVQLLAGVVEQYFKEDDPANIMNWLI